MGLTVKRVAKLSAPGRYGDGHGLYLQVRSETNKSWLLRYERNKIEHWHGLGSVADYTLEEARERARLARQLVRSGRDPIAEAIAQRRVLELERAKSKTFKTCAETFYEQNAARWRNAKVRDAFIPRMERWAFPIIGDTPIGALDPTHILRVLEQPVGKSTLWAGKSETARKLRGFIKQILDWSVVRGYRAEGSNPTDGLRQALPPQSQIRRVEHHAALPYASIPAFFVELRARQAVAARALEFVILTASRTNEAIGARWPEIDLDRALWIVPGERMKGGKEHRVPLAREAVALLRKLPRDHKSD